MEVQAQAEQNCHWTRESWRRKSSTPPLFWCCFGSLPLFSSRLPSCLCSRILCDLKMCFSTVNMTPSVVWAQRWPHEQGLQWILTQTSAHLQLVLKKTNDGKTRTIFERFILLCIYSYISSFINFLYKTWKNIIIYSHIFRMHISGLLISGHVSAGQCVILVISLHSAFQWVYPHYSDYIWL